MIEKNSSNRPSWTINLVEPGDGSGDAMLPLPDDLLQELGWQEGDILSISRDEQGAIRLTKNC